MALWGLKPGLEVCVLIKGWDASGLVQTVLAGWVLDLKWGGGDRISNRACGARVVVAVPMDGVVN